MFGDKENISTCDDFCIHEEVVQRAKQNMLKEEIVYDLADLFKVLGDSTRIKILRAISLEEMCVCDIASLFAISQSAISHQLRTLKNARLVKSRRDGKNIYYALDDEHVDLIINQGLEHILHQ